MTTKWTAERKAKFRATVAAKKAAKEHGHSRNHVSKAHHQSADTHRAFIINLLQHAEREITNQNVSKALTYTKLALDEMQGSSSEGT